MASATAVIFFLNLILANSFSLLQYTIFDEIWLIFHCFTTLLKYNECQNGRRTLSLVCFFTSKN